jgi:hypothetical protein
MTVTYAKTNKNVVFYQGAGLKGSIRLLTSQFPGAPDAELEISGPTFGQGVVKASKVKETKEERKARLAAMSPEEKQAAAKANAAARLAAAQKRAAALGL